MGRDVEEVVVATINHLKSRVGLPVQVYLNPLTPCHREVTRTRRASESYNKKPKI